MIKELMIKDYLNHYLPASGLYSETVEGQLVLVKDGCYHIYLEPFTVIGTVTEDDMVLFSKVIGLRRELLDIYNNVSC